jgi:hypothetical protein
MRRLALLLALLTALGPASLRWVHEATAHPDHADHARAVACDDAHHHDHDAEHHESHDEPAPEQDHGCAVCDELATLSACDLPSSAISLPAPRPSFDEPAPVCIGRPAPLAALRAMPPPAA